MSELIGAKKLEQQLKALGAAAGGKSLRSAVMSASLPALRAIQAAAPQGSVPHRTYRGRLVAPGFLSRNIRRKSYLSRDKSLAGVVIGPVREAFYAQFLEFGTSKMAKRPFMEPAFRAAVPKMQATLAARLKGLIDRASK